MTELTTARLTIRNFRQDDWKALQRIVIAYQSSVFAAFDREWPTSDDMLQEIAQWFSTGESMFAVSLAERDMVIGFVTLDRTGRKDIVEYSLGYVFDSDFHGQGYATEACGAAIAHAFIELDAENIVTGTAADNAPSLRLLERIGMIKTGEALTSFRRKADGKPMQFIAYSFALSKAEWLARRPGAPA